MSRYRARKLAPGLRPCDIAEQFLEDWGGLFGADDRKLRGRVYSFMRLFLGLSPSLALVDEVVGLVHCADAGPGAG